MEVSDQPSILAAVTPTMNPLLLIERTAGWAPGNGQCREDGKLLRPQVDEFLLFGLPARGLVSKQSFSGLLLGGNESHFATV
jgi:hypothetical protein